MYTREEFEQVRTRSAADMAADQDLSARALGVLACADRYRWIHQTTWLGEPILNLPQDMFAIQEIIFETRPKMVIETGVAWGGSLLFYASILEALGGGHVIGVDVYLPSDLRARILAHGRVSKRITLIEGSSVAEETAAQLRTLVGGSRDVMLILDSDHTHAHVLSELRLLSVLVGKGHYLVCGDTVVESLPVQDHRPRAWGPGNNPMTALDTFLSENDRFTVDTARQNKLLFTCNPGGYLRCQKD